MDTNLTAQTTEFFDDFVAAFKTFDGAVIAQRYFSPYVAVQTDGRHKVLEAPSDIAKYFQEFLDQYHANGCRSCGYKELEIATMGQCVLATVTWELYNIAGGMVSSWRESYSLSEVNGRLLVYASIDHAG